jgi:glutamine cyclotransferase
VAYAPAACAAPPEGPTPGPAPAAPARIGYRIVESFTHDPSAFTQGLLYHDGRLLESTGQFGASSLREVEIRTGRVIRRVELPRHEFGEGLALAGGQLFQLTWRNGVAYRWNPTTFAALGSLPFEGEGWGLAFDGKELVQSDGSARLTFRSPDTFAPTRVLDVSRAGTPQFYLNELEWIDGAIWANVWMSDEIVRIDPASGRVTGVLDLTGLLTPEEASRADVLNGLAWDPGGKILYVTGKYWPRLFALELR